MSEDIIRGLLLALSGAGVVGVGRGLSKFLGRAMKRELREAITEVVEEQLELIKKRTEELIPNHGSSLADAVRRIERRLGQVEEQIDEVISED